MPNFHQNPYIVGKAITDPEKFFGREDLFDDINDFLKNNEQIILLSGQRRIGKSSVIAQIPKKLGTDEFVFISFDFQDTVNSSHQEIIRLIATRIIERLETNEEILTHLAENISTNIDIFYREFLPAVYQQLGNKKLVLLWDEFDVLTERDTELSTDSDNFCNYIRQLLEKDQKLFIIPIVGRNISKLPKLVSSLRPGVSKEIGLLDKNHTRELIVKPAERFSIYEEEAIEAIFNLSAGHPFVTQAICLAIHDLARTRSESSEIDMFPWTISSQDVESIVNKAIELAEGGLKWFWDGLTTEQKVIFAAVAKAQDIAIQENKDLPQPPLSLLNSYGIVSTEYLNKAHEQLYDYGFLDNSRRRIKVEFVRRWLMGKVDILDLKDEIDLVIDLKDAIGNLEKIEEENIKSLISVAKNKPQMALQFYNGAFDLNPNNFTTVMYLAEEYLKIGQLNKAHELYKRAYQFSFIKNKQESVLQPLLNLAKKYSDEENFEQALEIYTLAYDINEESSKDSLIETSEEYGHQLILKRKWAEAEEQFDSVLQIDPQRKISQQKLEEIQSYKSKTNVNIGDTNYVPVSKPSGTISRWLNRGSILIASCGLAGIIVLGASISQVFKTCPTGERKESGVFCVVDNSRISRGDRTFFSEITDIPRDKGIQAFKQGNYQLAANLFQQAVKANQNDPEVLIYYNNALARKQGSPFTLAVVVPLDKNQDDRNNGREILRGVAQAQDQFNQKNGLNSRLLEIVIANDSNTGKAKEVAQELTEDSSILGVIGHNSSDATRAVIPEYEKAKLAVISSTSTSIFLNNPVFFRAVNSDESAGKTLAEYTYKNLKLKKAVIFANPNSPYSNSIREVFTNQFEKLGGEVVRKPLIDLTASIFDPEKEVTKSVYANNAKAEAALLFPDTRSTNIALNTAKEITKRNERLKTQKRPELKMLGGDTLYTHEILTNGGNNVEGLIIAAPWFRETSQAKSFANKADKKWGGPISWRTATSFDATQALIKTLSNNPSRSTVLRGLENVSLPASETSGYPLKFTSEREREGESILLQVKGNQFVQIDPPAKP
ncbi:MAG: ABC transporter substrate-binding protein [Dolichospermum sp. LBC05a]|nr:ABC transporter substrate-binding protein [Dolichospermum sp. OL01]MCO5797742.1 ABC transporter substrate-binding protein [Dolichospermum sp. OL03]MCS6279782.1 ABC transporter substrate-binding protein [Dolichospermum sp.]QSV59240.1 MAG: ABC transporter substrate-binding protein [Dolichospermum sp. LBC05a]